MYPPTLFIIFTVLIVLTFRYGLKRKNDRMIKVLYLITATVIVVNYAIKLFSIHIH